MADRAITALTKATALGSSDLFVLSQGNQAKSATWQLIISYLTTALDGHGGIQSIEKTSTSGLVDTYTVTLADQTTYSFTVTNAKSIASITKTPAAPPSLTDTYTITYNDGDTDTFTMDNGRGISSIVKTSAVAPSLTDTYTVNYNDGTSYTFTVDNGKAIASLTDKWAVSDDNTTEPETWYETLQTMTPVNRYLWHYQVITFNDASTLDTDAAVVGVYGDTGQNWYVHIKYSSARPTQDSDMGDIPDDWIGIYSGTSSTAPTSYTSYSWFQYKGEKGDTGDASAITSQSVTYMEGNSGTVVPSGSWSPSIPPVAQGNYLWTRTILNFNDGSTVTSYSVARMGVDGSGSVSTVNNVSPDGNGNVALDADDIPTDDNTSVQARINGVEDSIEKHDADLAVPYDPTSTYAVGDPCVYGNQLYRCITAVSVPDTFDPLKWEEVSVTGLTGELKNTLTQLETETETVENGLAIIVEGDSCASGASQGQYVYLKNSTITGYTDGLYTAAQAIPANTAIDGTYLTAVSSGGLNNLKNSLSALRPKLVQLEVINGSTALNTNITVSDMSSYKLFAVYLTLASTIRMSMFCPREQFILSRLYPDFSIVPSDRYNCTIEYVNDTTIKVTQWSSTSTSAGLVLCGVTVE